MYLAKINEIIDYIFTGGWKMPNLITGIGSHASTHLCAFFIFAFKLWDLDAPHRP